MRFYRFLAVPVLAWYVFFLVTPLVLVFGVSLVQRGVYGGLVWELSAQSYGRLFSPAVGLIFLRTVLLSFVTAFLSISLGVLTAWAIAAAPVRRRGIYFSLIVLPFLTNSLIRIVGLKTLVGMNGPLQSLLTAIHVPFDPFAMTSHPLLVIYGMVATYLPFAILPLYGAFEKFDFFNIEAAQDLGAYSFTQLTDVVIPILRKPLIQSFLLVFIPCLGEYAIPDLLGGAKTTLMGNLITEQFLRARDWPYGAAISMALIAVIVVVGFAARRLLGREPKGARA